MSTAKTLKLPPPKPFKPQYFHHKMPALLFFTPIQHKHTLHRTYNTLPHSLHNLEEVKSVHIFRLFMNDIIFNTIAINTNLIAEKQQSKEGVRDKSAWDVVSAVELRC